MILDHNPIIQRIARGETTESDALSIEAFFKDYLAVCNTLSFYADQENYTPFDKAGNSKISLDNGQRARIALDTEKP